MGKGRGGHRGFQRIGAAVARALAREGAHVALAARRRDTLFEVQSGLEELGGAAKSLVAATDVTDREQVKALVELAEDEFGPVEILVDCTGIMYCTPVLFPKYTTYR